MCCGYTIIKTYWIMKRFNFSEPLSSCHPFHFTNNSSHTPLHGWVDPNFTGFLGEHWKGTSRGKFQGHRPKADKYFPQCLVHWGKEKKNQQQPLYPWPFAYCAFWTIICMQSEPNESLAKAKVRPQSKSDLCRDEGGLGKMYFNFSSGQC